MRHLQVHKLRQENLQKKKLMVYYVQRVSMGLRMDLVFGYCCAQLGVFRIRPAWQGAGCMSRMIVGLVKHRSKR